MDLVELKDRIQVQNLFFLNNKFDALQVCFFMFETRF